MYYLRMVGNVPFVALKTLSTSDHIDNNGAEHKRTLFGAANTSQRLYAWLRRNEYPPGFQVLCWNHNASKQFSPELCEEPYEFEP
jgi:hypothetical protein